MKIAIVNIEEIWVDARVREEFGDIGELATSIKEEGLIQPLAVFATPNEEKPYRLLAGERRLKACKHANVEQVPVRIYERELSDLEMRRIEAAENLYRKDFTYVEECRAKRDIYELEKKIYGKRVGKDPSQPGVTQKEVAEKYGQGRSQFHDDVELAEAMEVIPDLAKCKNKSEAMRLLKSMKEDLVKQELAKRLDQTTETSPTSKIIQDLCNRYIIGDFFDMVKQVPDKSINLVEIDPPYAINLQSMKKTTDGRFPYNPDNYNEIETSVYEGFIKKVMEECYRVMADHSWMILWFGPEPWFEHIFKTAKLIGFEGKRITASWVKPTGQTMQPSYNLANCKEDFFYLRKGKPAIIQQGRSNIFQYPPVSPSKKIHPTERPIEMMADILATFTSQGSRVLVPFAGSGNTLLAAANMRMTGIGYDLSQSYKDNFILRVHQAKPGEYTSL